MLRSKIWHFSCAGTPPAEFSFNLIVARGEIVVWQNDIVKSDCRIFNA